MSAAQTPEILIPEPPPDDTLFLQRAVKEAVHELGHTCGLGALPQPQVHYVLLQYPARLRRERPGVLRRLQRECESRNMLVTWSAVADDRIQKEPGRPETHARIDTV